MDLATAPATTPRTEQDWGLTLVLLAGTFIAVLDFFIVNVAIPSIQRDLGAPDAAIQFMVAGYALPYSAGLISGGRLGDILGRRRMYLWGLALFTLASVGCGLAPNPGVLVALRVVQGAAAALLTPQVLGIFGAVYGGEAKARAINAYGVTVGVAAVFGQLIGGLLIQANLFGLGWRTCFLINVPVGAVALVLTLRRVPETRAPRRPGLDPVGMALISLALVAVVLPMIEGREQGWPLWGWVCLAAAVPLFAAFGIYEERLRRGGGSPLLDLRLFRERAFSAGLTALIVFYGGMASYFLVLALYLQFGRGLDALGAGLVFIAVGTGYLGASLAARHIAARLGRQAIAVGGLLRILGLAVLIATVARIGVSGSALWLVPGLIIDGAGLGLAVAPLTSTVLARMTPQHAGAASGVLATGLQVGNALGVAVIGVVFYGLLPPGAETVAGHNPGYGHAFGWSLVYLTGVAITLIALVQVLPRGVERGSAVGGR